MSYTKDFPSGFFREQKSRSRDRTFCLGISTFFRGVPRIRRFERSMAACAWGWALGAVPYRWPTKSDDPGDAGTETKVMEPSTYRPDLLIPEGVQAFISRGVSTKLIPDRLCAEPPYGRVLAAVTRQ